jgi:transposase
VLPDNRSVHRDARARRLIEEAGCALRFLPRSSPDRTPIEPAFAKLKQAMRRAEARTFEAPVAAAGYPLPAQHL